MRRLKRDIDWPRYMKRKCLRNGGVAFYWQPHARDVAAGFTLHSEPLGKDFAVARDRAAKLNAHLDAWRTGQGTPEGIDSGARFGSIDWWIESYTRTEAFTKLSVRSQQDYREALQRLADLPTNTVDKATGRVVRVGELPASSLSPAAVDRIYKALRKEGTVTRQANYVIDVARKAWRIVARQYPGHFMVPVETAQGRTLVALNPFQGLERVHSKGTTIPATREQAWALAQALSDIGHHALGAAALIAYEWHQRPENIIAGHLTWTDYRPSDRPKEVRIFHHKTGEHLWLPLEYDGERLYPELEDWLSRLPRLGVPIVLLKAQRGGARPYSESYADHLVQKARKSARLPDHVTLAACRHGGMTELGDAEITEQGIMALSGHRTPHAARIYVKRTEKQRLAASVQRRRFLESEREANESEVGMDHRPKWE
jgi:hypothetical protein